MIKRFSSFVNEGTFIPHLFTDFTDSIGETNIFIGKTRRKIKAPGKYPLPGRLSKPNIFFIYPLIPSISIVSP